MAGNYYFDIPTLPKNNGLFRAGCIYALKCPDTELVRYIGKSFNIKARINQHFNPRDKERTHKDNWIRSLKSQNKFPVLEIIDTCDEFDWEEKEIFYIKLYKSFGANLLNHTQGGEQGALNYSFNVDQRLKLSQALKGKKKSESHKLNAKAALADKFKNDESYREKMKRTARVALSNLTDEQKKKSRLLRRIGQSKRSKITFCRYIQIGIKMKEGMSKTDACRSFGITTQGIRQYCVKRNLKEYTGNVKYISKSNNTN